MEISVVIFVGSSIALAAYILLGLHNEPNRELMDQVDKSLWLDKIHNDPLIADASEEDYHKDRGDEDWHGL